MQSVHVELTQNPYSIFIGSGLLTQKDLLSSFISGRQVLIVTNKTVAPLYLDKVKNTLHDYSCDDFILPDGEQFKTLESVQLIFDKLLASGHTRTTTLIALGGGVVGDLTGFAAACYMRGVNFIQIPTTLLAQVDAAIGGKTGVNHPRGKNMIGAFHQPRCVIADIDTLNTLPQREFCAGLAEVIKYGLIQDANFFAWLETNIEKLLQKNPESLAYAILRSCEIKAALVAVDEREAGVRAFFNLGHTFGHAIENGVGYGVWLHGEAVGVGMLIAANLSARLGWIAQDEPERVKNLLRKVQLPVQLPRELLPSRLLELMANDKKNIHGRLRLVLLKKLGEATVTDEVPLEAIEKTLQTLIPSP